MFECEKNILPNLILTHDADILINKNTWCKGNKNYSSYNPSG